MQIDSKLKLPHLKEKINNLWTASGQKLKSMGSSSDYEKGAPVVTVNGFYQPRSWTDWTEGFLYGSALLQFDATGDEFFRDLGVKNIRDKMAVHLSHFGVHDHGFNNHSTFGNLLRLIEEGKINKSDWARQYCILALKMSASVQARRWTSLSKGGYIYSFNGPHSLFVDTIRTIRVLVLGHLLQHQYAGENDARINLLHRAFQHALTTASYSIYYGDDRDIYDVRGRTAHESIFNINDGSYRCPGTQQGYSGFSTWTRGLSWAMLGFAEQLEFLQHYPDLPDLDVLGGKRHIEEVFLKAARATCDYFIENTAQDGIPYWDSGAPGLIYMPDWRNLRSNPGNDWEPVDSSAAVIGAQGLLRLAKYLQQVGEKDFEKYWSAGLTVAGSLFSDPYISVDHKHQGLILHAVYHRPNGWDHIPEGSRIPFGESCMWGDYHARELALYLKRMIEGDTYYTFFSGINP